MTDDSPSDLALACPACNRRKGPNFSTYSVQAGGLVRLFHPRLDVWEEHFEFDGLVIRGLTPIGEATIQLLQLNAEDRLQVRRELFANGEW